MDRTPFKINPTVTLANNGVTYVFDTTRGTLTAPTAAPGSFRSRYAQWGLKGTIKVGDQAVTGAIQGLVGVAGTSADWETEASGSTSFSANTTYPIRIKPNSPDWRYTITNGATGPSAITLDLMLIPIEQTEG